MDIKLLQRLWEVLSCKYTLLLYRLTWMAIKRIDAATNLNVLAHFLDKICSIFLLHLPPSSDLFYYKILFLLTCKTSPSTSETFGI